MSTQSRKVGVVVFLILSLLNPGWAARYKLNPPVLTVTLKDPDVSATSSTSPNNNKWLDLNALRPNAQWSVESRGAPLPNWMPGLKSIRASLGYAGGVQPSSLDTELRFAQAGKTLTVQPSYSIKQKKTSCIIQATSRNTVSLTTRISSTGKRFLDVVKGSFLLDLPFVSSASLRALKISPSFDFIRNSPTISLEGITHSGKTKAMIHLEHTDSTLTVVHALDAHNTISPEISLRTAKIIYHWNVLMESGSVRTRVDPTDAIHVTWTDRSYNGRWVTDFSLPLKGTSLKALAADVRVRRQFTF